MRIGFGVTIEKQDDPYVQMAIDVEDATANGGAPGATFLDYFPWLRYLPHWLPWTGPLRHARNSIKPIQALHDIPWKATEPDILNGRAQYPSFMRTHLEKYIRNEKEGRANEASIADLKGAAGAIAVAGGNTTWSTIIICILNMIRDPDVQKKAQKEIDEVIGGERLPNFEDRAKLPYLENIIKETTRWAPLSPVGVPHASVEDDTYDGMFIPAGSVIYANAWAMCHDETIYRDPDAFNPDRYTPREQGGAGEPAPEGPFGFGRRVCPGQILATAGVYIMMATILATMDLLPGVGPNGEVVIPEVKLSNGLSRYVTIAIRISSKN